MNDTNYDLVVIGAGSGGVRAARIAAGHGARVAICEESRVGGTCVIRGCVPKKLLVYGSHFGEEFEDAAAYGWHLQEASFSWPDLIANKDREIDRLNGIYHKLLDGSGVDTFMGRGRLVDAHTVAVDGRELHAQKILIATGARPFVPEFDGAELAITSDQAFHLDKLPRRIVISGGGYIAVEFAGIFNGLGSEVVLAYRRDCVLRGFDDDMRCQVEEEMTRKGITIRHHTEITSAERNIDGRLRVTYNDGGIEACDQLMFATGRHPNTSDLGLEDAGVEVDQKGAIQVDARSRSSQPNIFAVGDVTDRVNLTPVAIREGHAFADSEFGGQSREPDHVSVPAAVFSSPPIGTVGLTEAEARQRFDRLRVYRSDFRALKYTLTANQERTLIKMIVDDASDRVVGIHVIGLDAPEIVQGFAVAVKAGLTKDQFDATVGIHPTAGEELVTLRDAEIVEA